MKIALIADTFPPLRTSGAVQLRDLATEFVKQGHLVTVFLPAHDLEQPWSLSTFEGVRVLRLKAPRTKGIDYARRFMGEFLMPFAMLWRLRKSPLALEKWDGIIWYSPSIFHGPLVKFLKKRSNCEAYLIVRDIFPEWAVDMGLMRRGLLYMFFDAIARYQYSVADVIGVQTPGNCKYFEKWQSKSDRTLEVLQNWLGDPVPVRCSIRVNLTPLAGRKVFVYAGNMGLAQGMDILLDVVSKLQHRRDLGFLFVGRGCKVAELRLRAQERQLDNIVFYNEIHPNEIQDLYSQCCAGIVALDPRHKSHNIPGKFLTYMQSGLPVIANINTGNDLGQIIRDEQVGQVCESNDLDDLLHLIEELLSQIQLQDHHLSKRCRNLFEREFAVEKAVCQIVAAFNG